MEKTDVFYMIRGRFASLSFDKVLDDKVEYWLGKWMVPKFESPVGDQVMFWLRDAMYQHFDPTGDLIKPKQAKPKRIP